MGGERRVGWWLIVSCCLVMREEDPGTGVVVE